MRGVIFFSSTSSSAKFFWYFSQLEPVAEGMFALQAASGVGLYSSTGARNRAGRARSGWLGAGSSERAWVSAVSIEGDEDGE